MAFRPPPPSPCAGRGLLLYRTPVHGLNNQKLDVLGALSISLYAGRSLVLPYLFSDLLSGERPGGVPFEDVFDVAFLNAAAPDLCATTFPALPDLDESGVLVLPHGGLEEPSYYVALLADVPAATPVMLDRPPDLLAQFPLNLRSAPDLTARLRGALRPAPGIRELAERARAGFPPGEAAALHLRVEEDWREHCERRERAHFGQVALCPDAGRIGRQMGRFLETHPGVKAVYVRAQPLRLFRAS